MCRAGRAQKEKKKTETSYTFSLKKKIEKIVVNMGAAKEILTTVANGKFLNAINIAIKPANKNRNAEIDNGGATWTIIWAEVKALDHISAKVNPINVDLMSIRSPMEKAALGRRP